MAVVERARAAWAGTVITTAGNGRFADSGRPTAHSSVPVAEFRAGFGSAEGPGAHHQLVTVRRAEPADCREIAEVHVRTWRVAYRHVFPPELLDNLSIDEREALCRRLVESDSEVVWVALTEGRVVGFASAGSARTDEDAGELFALYVLPDAWGSEAAHELMAAAKDWFASEGYATAMLWVLADNPRACRFYEREGWQVEGMRVDTVRGVNVEEALYRLVLVGG
jgi:GNAT superfamily N-acetyltransferase